MKICHSTHLNVSGKWKVATLWMSLETVIGQDATQIGMIGKENTIHIPNLSLIPVGSFVDFITRVDGSELVGVSLHSDSRVVTKR